MLTRLKIRKGKPFTPVQKFVAIPLLLLPGILIIMELLSPTKNAATTEWELIIGGVFLAIFTIVGFWGIALQT